jgi:hypothetical protein
MPGVWRARSLVCKGRKHTSSHHRYAETIRHSLRDGSRLIRALLGVPGLLATVACTACRAREGRHRHPASLIPASGNQDHTTSLVRIRAARLAAPTRPSHPASHVRGDWPNAPPGESRMRAYNHNFLKNGRRIFGHQE